MTRHRWRRGLLTIVSLSPLALAHQTRDATIAGGARISAEQVAAQPPAKRVPYKVTCPTCRVELTPVVTLGKRSDPQGISFHSTLDRDRQGRFFAIGDNYQVLVYDARGNFIKALGRRGQGPGEFDVGSVYGVLAVAIGPGDSIFVFHPPGVTVFSPELVYARRFVVPGTAQTTFGFRALADGTWLIAASIRGPQQVGRARHVMSGDGTIRRSLGPEQALSPDLPPLAVTYFYLSRDRRTIHLGPWDHRYLLESWDLEGRPLSGLEVVGVPYHREPTYREVRRRNSQRPYLRAVGAGSTNLFGVDTLGQLWIHGRGPDSTAVHHLDIVDPRTGEIRSSQVVPNPVQLLPSGDLAYAPTMADDGFFSFTVSRYRFVGR